MDGFNYVLRGNLIFLVRDKVFAIKPLYFFGAGEQWLSQAGVEAAEQTSYGVSSSGNCYELLTMRLVDTEDGRFVDIETMSGEHGGADQPPSDA